jgi:hypothetical protein
MRVAARINPDQPSRDKCLVTVKVHLAGLTENMTINVLVARDADGVQEAAIARAKDFARRFASQT